ncbi:MAG: rane-bound lytic murein transglycosylase precursor [Chitinophagaceae bacterium]|nr:rane-bound lytic murein transglycosylase precursor [Chitinophagaceae bacterium]
MMAPMYYLNSATRQLQLFREFFSLKILLFSLSLVSFSASYAHPVKQVNSEDSVAKTEKNFKTLIPSTNDIENSISVSVNPKVMPFMDQYLKEHETQLENMKQWGKPYFDMYDKVLQQNGIPTQLKYLSVIESDLKATALSKVGARGPWQLMPSVARELGLKVGGGIDERTDYTKSTEAATKLLKDLYGQFGDWLLVVAAYNCGAGRVQSAIDRAGTTDFWQLQYSLPEESRNHVKKFISTQFMFEGKGGVTTMTSEEAQTYKAMVARNQELVNPTIDFPSITISGKYKAAAIVKALDINMNDFNKLNPLFDRSLKSGQEYQLRLPSDKTEAFQAKKQQILQDSVNMLLAGS